MPRLINLEKLKLTLKETKMKTLDNQETSLKAELCFRGPCNIVYKVKNILCPDGKRRTAYLTSLQGSSSNYRITVKGKSVTGFVTYANEASCTELDELDYKFIPFMGGKNAKLFFNNYMIKVD